MVDAENMVGFENMGDAENIRNHEKPSASSGAASPTVHAGLSDSGSLHSSSLAIGSVHHSKVDWNDRVEEVRRRFENVLYEAETIDGWESWLQQVPEADRPSLRQALRQTQNRYDAVSTETRVLSSDQASDNSTTGSEADSHSEPLSTVFGSSDGLLPERGFGSAFKPDDRVTHTASAVSGCDTFRGLSDEATLALETRLVQTHFAAGQTLMNQGQPSCGLHLLLSGNVDITDAQTGHRIDIDGAGSVLGEMSLLTGQPCSADVIATSDVTALTLSSQAYEELKTQHPEFEIALSQLVSDRLGNRNHDALCGKTIGDYQLLRCINRGGMGVVYEARKPGDPQHVALKMLRHRFIYDNQMQDRFDQEAVLLAGLRHPNIVSFRAHFLAFRTRFLVLDLCDGPDLFRLSRVCGPMPEPAARAVLGQIARGLQHAHADGVIHRDLKPGNVLVQQNGRARLTDFGLSKLLETEVPGGKAVGTPSYMPPEQFRNENVGPESDWYALGCLACELLTGELLFRGGNWRAMYAEKRDRVPSRTWPAIDVSSSMRSVIRGLLEPDAKRRRADLKAMARWADESIVAGLIP